MGKLDFGGFVKDLQEEIGKAESAVQMRMEKVKSLEKTDPYAAEGVEGPLSEAESHLARCREVLKHQGSVSEIVEFLVLASREIGRAEGRLYSMGEKTGDDCDDSDDYEVDE